MSVLMRRRTVRGLTLGLLVVLAGCAGGAQLGGGGGDGGQQARDGPAADTGAEVEADGAPTRAGQPDGGGSGEGPEEIRQRAIVRTGQVELRVDDFDAAQRNLTVTLERYGGFVSDSRIDVNRVDNATYETGRLVLRVPSENFSAMMAGVQSEGEVQSVSTSSEDVTDRLVDIDARLGNLRAERDRLRGLYRNASDTEDVLAVGERLSDVQGEIERLEARKQSLQRQVALSTIRVEIREPRPDGGPIDADRWFDTPVLVAFLDSIDGVITSLRALVVAGAYGLPYLAVYGPVVVGAGYVIRRWRGRQSNEPAPGSAPNRSAPAATAGESMAAETTDEPTADDKDEPTADGESGGANGNNA